MREKAAGIPLPKSFYERPAMDVARDLMGKDLCRSLPTGVVRIPVTEVEAYIGPEDKACHAHRGMTQRNKIMFGPGGYWYVYLCYGIHWLLNVVCGPAGFPAAVLIRGVGNTFGPGRVTKQLQIDKLQHERPIDQTSGLWLEDSGLIVPEQEIQRTPRIGIDYAQEWIDKPFRLVWKAPAGK